MLIRVSLSGALMSFGEIDAHARPSDHPGNGEGQVDPENRLGCTLFQNNAALTLW